jgi:16S rRNA (adenine(1408)-N(1))-methyltransferase
VSRRAAGKPSRGGLANLRLGRLALADAPGALEGLADELTVILPWGSLLQAVALGTLGELGRLRGLCKPGARVEIVFGYGAASERAAIDALGLPAPEALAPTELAGRYRQAGFAVEVRPLALAEVAALSTTWARKLAFSGRDRHFWRITGRAVGPGGEGTTAISP